MNDKRDPHSSGTLAGLLALKMEMGGLCSNCPDARFVCPDTPSLIAMYGADAFARDVMEKIICKECGAHVEMRISAVSARYAAHGSPNSRK